MALTSPFKRTVRPFKDGEYAGMNDRKAFVRMPSYSIDPRSYIRGFLVLQRDIRFLFETIHPASQNLNTYSEHIGILFTRACFEVETNLSAILRENGYLKGSNLTIDDYKKIEISHKISEYEILLPEWHGGTYQVKPFDAWKDGSKLIWYSDYNKFKHDRVENLEKATFQNLIDAWCGLFALISAQFFLDEMSIEKQVIGWGHSLAPNEFWHGAGGYLKVKFPTSWEDHD
ncbi:MAG: hypothetical protein ACRCWF_12730, partial [Beijerinckiaceae bacterium]